MTESNVESGQHGLVPESLKKTLSGLGFLIDGFSVDNSTLILANPKLPNRFQYSAIPVESINDLADQLKDTPKPLADHFGHFTDCGYFEISLRMEFPRRSAFHSNYLPYISKLTPPGRSCEHAPFAFRAIDPSIVNRKNAPTDLSIDLENTDDAERDSFSGINHREYLSDRDFQTPAEIHLTDEDSSTCIELSHSSPCGIIFGLPRGSFASNQRSFWNSLSLKIFTPATKGHEEFVSRCYRIANSFLYELAVRNDLVLTPANRAELEHGRPKKLRSRRRDVRFPRIEIDAGVAQLYSFAETAIENPSLAFLSFYQILEYFFPAAIRKMTIQGVRRELADPKFDGSDGDIVRIIGIAESKARSNESEQIAALLEQSTREDRLREFFANIDRQRHFSKQGPIKGGVTSINPESKESLASQVANRVYLLRNRIVHAKDDPKYADAKVLLPRSREAALLWPDIELVRLLAQEVITDSQV